MWYPCKSGWNRPTSSRDMVHTSTFWLKFGSLSPAVTLKIRSRSPKSNQLFIMFQCYIRANLVKIHPPDHEISCIQESVTPTLRLTPTPTGSAQKTICPLPFGGSLGDITNMGVYWIVLSIIDQNSDKKNNMFDTFQKIWVIHVFNESKNHYKLIVRLVVVFLFFFFFFFFVFLFFFVVVFSFYQ